MTKIAGFVSIFAILSALAGCNRHTVVIDPAVPHLVVPDQVISVYAPREDGSMQQIGVRVGHRWFVQYVPVEIP